MKRVIGVLGAALLLSGCTTFSRLTSYGGELADAHVTVVGHGYSVYVHPQDDTLLIQRRFAPGLMQSFGQGLTMGAAKFTEAMPYWRSAARAVLDEAGCEVGDVYLLDDRSWEARFTCPPGADIRRMAVERRAAWRAGLTGPAPY